MCVCVCLCVDADGDKVVISSDAELVDALDQFEENVFRIHLLSTLQV